MWQRRDADEASVFLLFIYTPPFSRRAFSLTNDMLFVILYVVNCIFNDEEEGHILDRIWKNQSTN